jgi:hypothetical protein
VGLRRPYSAAGHQFDLVDPVDAESWTPKDDKLVRGESVIPRRETSHDRPVTMRNDGYVDARGCEGDHPAKEAAKCRTPYLGRILPCGGNHVEIAWWVVSQPSDGGHLGCASHGLGSSANDLSSMLNQQVEIPHVGPHARHKHHEVPRFGQMTAQLRDVSSVEQIVENHLSRRGYPTSKHFRTSVEDTQDGVNFVDTPALSQQRLVIELSELELR